MNIKVEFFNIKIQNCNIITHDVNSKMSIKKYKILFLILAVITLHTLQGNPCFSRFKTSRCLESLRITIFWKQLIIAEVLSTICIIFVEFLVKISLVKCVVNWSLDQFETFVVQNMYF